MRKYILPVTIILLAVVCVLFGQYIARRNLRVIDFQMGRRGEVSGICQKEDFERTLGYHYFVDGSGKNVVAELIGSSDKIKTIWTFDSAAVSMESPSRIQEGMTFPEVVSILGFPTVEGSVLSGFYGTEHRISGGKYILVYWDTYERPATVQFWAWGNS